MWNKNALHIAVGSGVGLSEDGQAHQGAAAAQHLPLSLVQGMAHRQGIRKEGEATMTPSFSLRVRPNVGANRSEPIRDAVLYMSDNEYIRFEPPMPRTKIIDIVNAIHDRIMAG